MPEATWLNLAIQIPVVVVFALIVFTMLKMFLAHMLASDIRSQAFIKEQREANNRAITEMGVSNRVALERLTDSICAELEKINEKLVDEVIMDVGHDAFVRTAFKERFGNTVIQQAEKDSENAMIAKQAEMGGQK
jgi:hypothetical protein